jgi:hypothetical protein
LIALTLFHHCSHNLSSIMPKKSLLNLQYYFSFAKVPNLLMYVVTLTLGSQPKQRACKVQVRTKPGSHILMPSGMQKSVKERTFTLPSELPCWELESQWTPECSESDYKGQNPMGWGVLCTIIKILKCRCLKWARITHLDIWNTSYGQKKGQESNWQFDSLPLKVGHHLNFLRVGGVWHTVEKLSTKATTLFWTSSQSKFCTQRYGGPKVAKVPILAILGLPLGSLETKSHLDVGLMEKHKVYYKGEGGGFPQVQAMVSLVNPSLPMARPSTKSAPIMH